MANNGLGASMNLDRRCFWNPEVAKMKGGSFTWALGGCVFGSRRKVPSCVLSKDIGTHVYSLISTSDAQDQLHR